jgi:hypothetical protein
MKSPWLQRTGRPPAPQPPGANSSIATRATSSQRETNPRCRPPRHGETSPILVTKNKDQLINDWKNKRKSPVIYGRRCRERKEEILLDKSRRRRREGRERNKGGRCMWANLFVSLANFSYQLLFLPCRLTAAPRRAPLPTATGRPRRYAPSSLLPTSSRVSWTSRHIDGWFPARVLSRHWIPAGAGMAAGAGRAWVQSRPLSCRRQLALRRVCLAVCVLVAADWLEGGGGWGRGVRGILAFLSGSFDCSVVRPSSGWRRVRWLSCWVRRLATHPLCACDRFIFPFVELMMVGAIA